MDDEFIKKWKPSYVKMIGDARQRVLQEEQKYAEPYIVEDVTKPNVLKDFAYKLDKVIFRLDDERIKKGKEAVVNWAVNNPTKINDFVRQAAKDAPEKADLLYGLFHLYNAIDVMNSSAQMAPKEWCLNVLKDFCEIYKNNPNTTDMDAMIQFIGIVQPTDHFDEINKIPREARDSIGLNFDENLKAFVQQYAKEYLKEDISFGNGSM